MLQAKTVVNCAGPWAGWVAKLLGYSSPSKPVRRQISVFDCRGLDLSPYGMIVDTNFLYFHPEGGNGLAGFAVPREPEGYRFQYDGDAFFMEHIWPTLFERSSYFEQLKHLTGWAGLYEVSPDESAIIGRVVVGEPGKVGGVYEAHSFSGHGVMQSYAAGKMLAEEIMKGKTSLRLPNQDLSLIMRGDRFERGEPIEETQVI
jgi:glycine/D-amino acid oxidase-like deaminating enzyme